MAQCEANARTALFRLLDLFLTEAHHGPDGALNPLCGFCVKFGKRSKMGVEIIGKRSKMTVKIIGKRSFLNNNAYICKHKNLFNTSFYVI